MSRNKSERRRLRRKAMEQDKRHELFTKTIRQQNMFHGFGFGVWTAAVLFLCWFQYGCKFSLANPEEIKYFIMVSSFFCLIFGWTTACDFDHKDGLANFPYLAGFFTCTLTYVFSQGNLLQSGNIIATLLIACFSGACLWISYHRLKAIICSLPRCFSRNPNLGKT